MVNASKITKTETIALIGVGRVGLPFALVLAEKSYKVYGIGRSEKKIEILNKGKMPFREKHAAKLLKKHIGKNLQFTTNYEVITKCDYIILTLGTPVDENMNPIMDQIITAVNSAKKYFKKNQTLILRSTVSPRTTQFVKTVIEESTSLKVGKNFFLAFCPERIAEGNAIEEIQQIPQIIGGVDKKSSKKAHSLFSKIVTTTLITDDLSAELAKLFTNMYRYINFAIANEFMLISQNYHRNIYEIVNLVNHKYKRGGLSVPGLTSGPCLYKDGFFLISDIPYIELIAASWKINETVPLFLIKSVRERMKLKGKKAVILGLGFKPEIDDIRESLSFKLRKALIRENSKVHLHDPYVKKYQNQVIEKDVYEAIKDADLLIFSMRHKTYSQLNMKKVKSLVKKNCIICDVWNVLGSEKIVYKANTL